MRKLFIFLVILGWLVFAFPLEAQQVCPGLPYVANTPEDDLMQAVNGAEKPEEQIAALDNYVKEHADSKFIPCVYEYYAMVYLKLNNYEKTIEYAEKGLSSDYKDVMLMLNVLKGYVGAGKLPIPFSRSSVNSRTGTGRASPIGWPRSATRSCKR